MKKDFALIDLLDANPEEATITEEHLNRIINLLENTRFGMFNREFVNMFDYFNSLKK